MFTKSAIGSIILGAATSTCFAECYTQGCDNVYVEKLYINASGPVYIGTSGGESKLPCSPPAGVYVTLDLTEPGSNAIYSALLTAQTTNKLVQLRTDENSTGCKVLYLTMDKQ